MPDSFDDALRKARGEAPSFDDALKASRTMSFDEALSAATAVAEPPADTRPWPRRYSVSRRTPTVDARGNQVGGSLMTEERDFKSQAELDAYLGPKEAPVAEPRGGDSSTPRGQTIEDVADSYGIPRYEHRNDVIPGGPPPATDPYRDNPDAYYRAKIMDRMPPEKRAAMLAQEEVARKAEVDRLGGGGAGGFLQGALDQAGELPFSSPTALLRAFQGRRITEEDKRSAAQARDTGDVAIKRLFGGEPNAEYDARVRAAIQAKNPTEYGLGRTATSTLAMLALARPAAAVGEAAVPGLSMSPTASGAFVGGATGAALNPVSPESGAGHGALFMGAAAGVGHALAGVSPGIARTIASEGLGMGTGSALTQLVAEGHVSAPQVFVDVMMGAVFGASKVPEVVRERAMARVAEGAAKGETVAQTVEALKAMPEVAEAPKAAPAPAAAVSEAPARPVAADKMNEMIGGMAEDLLSGSAVLTNAETSAVSGAWRLLSRAIGSQGTAADVYEATPAGATRADMADAMATIKHVHDLRVRRGVMPESQADTSLPAPRGTTEALPVETPSPEPVREAETASPSMRSVAEAAPPVEVLGAALGKGKAASARAGKSLAGFVRSQKGFDYQREVETGGLTGELDMLRAKEGKAKGLVSMSGKGKTPEEMMQSARESGYDVPEGMTPGEFIQRVYNEQTGLESKTFSPETTDPVAMAEADARRRGEEENAQILSQYAVERRPPLPEGPTSTKVRVVDTERVARGDAPMERTTPETEAGWVAEAKRTLEENPAKGEQLTEELFWNKRPATPVEREILLIHRVNLNKSLRAADKAGEAAYAEGNAKGVIDAKKNAIDYHEKLVAAEIASQQASSESGRSLRAIQTEMADNYTLARMEADRRRLNDYRPLTAEQKAETDALHEELAKVIADRDAIASRLQLAEAREGTGQPRPASSRAAPRLASDFGARNKLVSREAYEAAKKTLLTPSSSLHGEFAGLSAAPEKIAALVKMGTFYIEGGIRNFGEWAAKMREELKDEADKYAPYLEQVWKDSREQLGGKGRKARTDEQRIEAALKATDKSIAEYERQIETGDVFPAEKAKGPTDARLDTLRERRDALQQKRDDIRKAAEPRVSDYERAQNVSAKRTEKRAEDYERRTVEGDFAPREPRVPLHKNKAMVEAQARVDTAKKAWEDAKFRDVMANEGKAQKIARIALVEAPNLSRAVMTSPDVSAVLRQAFPAVMHSPVIAAKALWPMLKTYGNPKAGFRAARSEFAQSGNLFKAFLSGIKGAGQGGKDAMALQEAKLKLDPDYALGAEHGLDFTEHGEVPIKRMEEGAMSRAAEHIPLVAGSQRAHVTFLNTMRLEMFKLFKANLGPEPTPAELKVIAGAANLFTGRGNLPANSVIAGMNGLFFSPQLMASRIKILAGTPLLTPSGTARTRILMAKAYARMFIGAYTVLAIAKMAGADVEEDPRSSDFLKVKIGNTRLDPMGGFSQFMVLGARGAMGETKNAKGDIVPLRGPKVPYGGMKTSDAIKEFLQKKLAPIPAAGLHLLDDQGGDFKPTSVGKEALGLVTPISIDDIVKAGNEQGWPKGTMLAILSLFGMGLNTYDPNERTRARPRR